MRKKKLTVRVITLCNRLPREVVESQTLQTVRVQLEMVRVILILLILPTYLLGVGRLA